jgi:hypothetical protein
MKSFPNSCMEYRGFPYWSLNRPPFYVMGLGICRLIKKFTKTESRRKQRFIRIPLKEGRQ